MAVLFRVRKGDFVYSDLEKEIMLADIDVAIQHGVDTIVFGALNSEYQIDENFIAQIVDRSYGHTLVFHKAIDALSDYKKSIDLLKKYQIDRILSSGLANTALEGRDTLEKMNEYSGGQIEIMAGGSIDSSNVQEIITCSKVKRIHAALLEKNTIQSKNGNPEIVHRKELEKLLQLFRN